MKSNPQLTHHRLLAVIQNLVSSATQCRELLLLQLKFPFFKRIRVPCSSIPLADLGLFRDFYGMPREGGNHYYDIHYFYIKLQGARGIRESCRLNILSGTFLNMCSGPFLKFLLARERYYKSNLQHCILNYVKL